MDSFGTSGSPGHGIIAATNRDKQQQQLLHRQQLQLIKNNSSTISRSPSITRSSEQMEFQQQQQQLRSNSAEVNSTKTTTVAIATTTTTKTAAVANFGNISGSSVKAASTSGSAPGSASGSGFTLFANTGSGSNISGNTVTGSINSGSVNATTNAVPTTTQFSSYRSSGYRSQSPTHRRSRERQRREFQRTHGSDQGGLLAAYNISKNSSSSNNNNNNNNNNNQFSDLSHMDSLLGVGGGLSVNVGGIGGVVGSLEESRLSGTEDLCYQSFASDDLDGDGSKKHYRRHERTTSLQALDRINTKIQCTKESIRKEQTARDDNVNEYLKLAASADKQQLQRIKAVFEKKNQKSAHTISQLQKKLDNYTKRAKDLQNNQYYHKSQHRQPREMLRDVGQGLRNVGGNIRDGITGFSGSVMSKPREFAHLIKNKFGSADNINQMSEHEINTMNNMPSTVNSDLLSHNTTSNNIPTTSIGSGNTGGAGSGKFNSENGSECSSVTSESLPAGSGKSQSGASQYHIVLKSLLTELSERKDEIEKLKERLERLENSQKDFANLTATLEGERYRAETLEEQINDLTELHQNEIENLKQTIADMEEKVQYQSDERLRDINEVLENCQTRISKMEHLSQQQYVTVEGIDNSNARALVVKLINIVLTILQVVLLLVATAAGIIMPFLKTRLRVLTTFLSIFVIIFVIRQWPDVQDIGSGLVRLLKASLVVK